MRKTTTPLLTLAFVLSAVMAFSQNLTLSNYTNLSSDPGTSSIIDSYVYIDNGSTSPITVIVEREIMSLVPGHLELFCFGTTCYGIGDSISQATNGPVIPGGGKDQSFKATVIPNGTAGTSWMRYVFYDAANISDSVGVDLGFQFGATGLGDNAESFGMSKPLRNPADQYTVLTYNLQNQDASDRLVVFNALGSQIKSMDVPGKNGTMVVNTADLRPGVYFVSYLSSSKVKNTYKLVVSHR